MITQLAPNRRRHRFGGGYNRTPFPTRFALDRRVFAYRRVVTDDTVACIVVITVFFASVTFIVLFLGLESVIEGVSAGQSVSAWVS